MSDIGRRAEGIQRAEQAGGLIIERYRRPGFTGETAIRVIGPSLAGGSAFEVWSDPEPNEDPA